MVHTNQCYPCLAILSTFSLKLTAIALLAFILLSSPSAFGNPQSIARTDEETLVIESSPDMEIISFSKNVVIKNAVKGVLVFGHDVEIQGRVEGDVAAIGGSVIQKDGAFIGGDVIVIGGKYSAESSNPLRGEQRETYVIAAYEDEIRQLARDPLAIFSPTLSPGFFALRGVLLLFWFLLSIGFTTIAPGAVTRAVSRLRLSSAKVVAIGFFAFLLSIVGLYAALAVLPNYLSPVVVGMSLLTIALAYTFGRVALHVTFGKLIQKYLLSERNQSESLGVLLGVVAWTVLLSLPYVWVFGLLALISAGIGLVLTARPVTAWKTH